MGWPASGTATPGTANVAIIDAVNAQLTAWPATTRSTRGPTRPPSASPPASRRRADGGAALWRADGSEPGSRVFFTCSGSEAVDSALKLARLAQRLSGHPERMIVVSRRNGYHGVNYGGTTAQGSRPTARGWGGLLPDVVQVDAEDLEAARSLFAERGDVSPRSSPSRSRRRRCQPAVAGYLAGLRRLCDDHGAFLIIDEVICGFGRLGSWWGAHRYGVRPDLITFAKGVTSGYLPLGGVLLGPRSTSPWPPTRGSCCATATPTGATPRRARPGWRRRRSTRRTACSSGLRPDR